MATYAIGDVQAHAADVIDAPLLRADVQPKAGLGVVVQGTQPRAAGSAHHADQPESQIDL